MYKGLLIWFITNVLSQGLPKNGQSDGKDKSSHAVSAREAKEHCRNHIYLFTLWQWAAIRISYKK
jgi:hypothetical protein